MSSRGISGKRGQVGELRTEPHTSPPNKPNLGGKEKRSPELTASGWEEWGFKIEIPEKQSCISHTRAVSIILLSLQHVL